MYEVKVDLLWFKMTSDESRSSGHGDTTETRHNKRLREIMNSKEEHLQIEICTHMGPADSPMTIHQELGSVRGTSSGSYVAVCRWIRHFPLRQDRHQS